MEKIKDKIRSLNIADYFRKSSRDGEKQVLSIPSQEKECGEFRDKWNLPKPKKVYGESKSAKYAGKRIGFTEMVSLIEGGQINAILCWHLNRLARNMREGGILIDLLSEGKLVIITSSGEVYDETSDMGIIASLFGASKQFSISLSRDVKRGQRNKATFQGYPAGLATLGFLNSKEGEKGTRWWYTDEERFWKVKKLFELFLTRRYSVGKLCKYSAEVLKLTTPSRKKLGGRNVTLANTYRMLKNPVHAGFFFVQGTRHELNKELPRAITEAEYNTIQEMISNKSRPRVQKHKAVYSGFIVSDKNDFIGQDVKFQLVCDCRHKFAFRNKTNCPRCNKKISQIESPKYFIQSYYYNNRKKKARLEYKSIQEDTITSKLLSTVVEKIELPTPLLDWSKKYIHELKDKEIDENLKFTTDRASREVEYERKKTRTRAMYRDLKMSEEEYDQDIAKLESEYKDLKEKDEKINWQEKMNEIVDLSASMKDVLSNGTFEAKRNILTKLGSNFVWNDEELIINNRKSINALISGIKSIGLLADMFGKEKTLVKQEFNLNTEQIHITLRCVLNKVRMYFADNPDSD